MHKSSKQIKKAIIPIAGYGLRLLPITKVIPKEMLPIIDKPVIQFAIEELLAAGITQITLVTTQRKRFVENFFSRDYELEQLLLNSNNTVLYNELINLTSNQITLSTVYQYEPKGLGHAIYCARNIIGDEPFIVLLPDDILLKQAHQNKTCLQTMLELFEQSHTNILAIEEIDRKNSEQYGIANISNMVDGVGQVTGLQEKPPPNQASSNLGVVGRYVLLPEVFTALETLMAKPNGKEIQLTDAISMMLNQFGTLAYKIQSKRFDCGNKLGYYRAILEVAKNHAEIGSI